jgi:hypothetical protein
MAINAIMKDTYLKNLKCAYTGASVQVRMTGLTGKNPIYFVEGAFDPGECVKDAVTLLRLLGTREGVMGIAREGKELVCPYTGEVMRLEKTAMGYHAVGGYRPQLPVHDPFLLARQMMTRDGVVPPNAPKESLITADERVDRTPDIDIKPVATMDQAREEAEKILVADGTLKAKVSVTVPGGLE